MKSFIKSDVVQSIWYASCCNFAGLLLVLPCRSERWVGWSSEYAAGMSGVETGWQAECFARAKDGSTNEARAARTGQIAPQ